jgi:spermidine synthase
MFKYHFGRCIYTSPSGYKVYDNFFYRWLTFDSNAYQTVINPRNPAKPILRYLPSLTLMARHFPADCCVLGLGGGSIAHILQKHCPGIKVLAVDSSQEVIDIAKQFFMIKQLSNLTILHKDALEFIEEHQQPYKHLIVDLYDAHRFPKNCASGVFFSACHRLLTDDGFFAINLANTNEQWKIFELVRHQFTSTIVIPTQTSANMVIIATKNQDKSYLLHHIQRCPELKKLI